MKKILIIFVIVGSMFSLNKLQAQQTTFEGNLIYSSTEQNAKDNTKEYAKFSESISNFSIYQFDSRSFYDYTVQGNEVKEFSFHLGNQQWDIVIWRHDVRAPGYRLLTGDGINPPIELKSGSVTTYRGYLKNDKETKVRMNIREGYMQGLIIGKTESYVFSNISAFDSKFVNPNADELIIYNSMNWVSKKEASCKFGDSAIPSKSAENLQNKNEETPSLLGWQCVEIGAAVDYKFQNRAGGIMAGETRMLDIFNFVQQYYQPLELNLIIGELFVESANSSTWGSNANFSPFRVQWGQWAESGTVMAKDYDVYSLYTFKNQNGGTVGLSAFASICHSFGSYGPSTPYPNSGQIGGLGNGVTGRFNVMDYFYAGWYDNLSKHAINWGHELGHNFDCKHINNSIMTSNITSAPSNFESINTGYVQTFKATRACLNAGDCQQTVSIEGMTSNSSSVFKVTPNPTNGSFNVEFTANGQSQIEIYNLLGELVYKKNFGSSKTPVQIENVDISILPTGNYLVRLQSGDNFMSQMINKN